MGTGAAGGGAGGAGGAGGGMFANLPPQLLAMLGNMPNAPAAGSQGPTQPGTGILGMLFNQQQGGTGGAPPGYRMMGPQGTGLNQWMVPVQQGQNTAAGWLGQMIQQGQQQKATAQAAATPSLAGAQAAPTPKTLPGLIYSPDSEELQLPWAPKKKKSES